MDAILPDIKNTTNWLICLDLLCIPAENTWVYSIELVDPGVKVSNDIMALGILIWLRAFSCFSIHRRAPAATMMYQEMLSCGHLSF